VSVSELAMDGEEQVVAVWPAAVVAWRAAAIVQLADELDGEIIDAVPAPAAGDAIMPGSTSSADRRRR
jgi:hypothetical protein